MEKDIRILPMLVMREVVVFPNMIMHLDVSRPASVKAVNAAVEGDRYIFLTAQRDPVTEEPDIKDICRIGCVAVIRQVISTPNEENIRIVVEGIYRCLDAFNRFFKFVKRTCIRFAAERILEICNRCIKCRNIACVVYLYVCIRAVYVKIAV